MGLLDALVVLRLTPTGFSNRMLREHLAPLLGPTPAPMTAGAMTYDLRRLRLHGADHAHPAYAALYGDAAGLAHRRLLPHRARRILRPGVTLTLAPDSAVANSPLRAALIGSTKPLCGGVPMPILRPEFDAFVNAAPVQGF